MCYRVLFVDDEKSVLQGIFRNLSFLLDVTTTYSADDGIALLRGPGHFDAVVTDINMPGKTGLDFVDEAQEFASDVPFIILSGCADAVTLESAESNQAIHQILTKPASAKTILAAIEDAIDQSVAAV